ncbi:MAG: nitrogenase iron protein NifH [Cyanobacteriota bacterium]
MTNSPRKIAIYGKGGIGKSTISSNLSAALSYMNYNPAQVGCDPKADSVNTLVGGNFIPTISENIQKYGLSENTIINSAYRGFNNVIAIESGGPPPGQGCAGRGVLVALEYIEKYHLFEIFNVDFVIFDVLGDIVCGGFAQPIRHGFANEIYIVTSAEYMALYAANNIAQSIRLFASQGIGAKAAGLIHNKRNIESEDIIIKSFSDLLDIPIVGDIPRSHIVQQSELQGKTVIEAFDKTDQAECYFQLAYNIINNKYRVIPKTVERDKIINLLNKYNHSLIS